MDIKSHDMPFRTVLVGSGSFAAGFQTLEEAMKDAVERTARASSMGMQLVYEGIPKPPSSETD